jgi:hypothetical protein
MLEFVQVVKGILESDILTSKVFQRCKLLKLGHRLSDSIGKLLDSVIRGNSKHDSLELFLIARIEGNVNMNKASFVLLALPSKDHPLCIVLPLNSNVLFFVL